MEYSDVLVRYGEIFLKSEYVRKSFTNRLVLNIKAALAKEHVLADVILLRHRIILKSDQAEAAAQRVSNVFGVVSASPAVEVGSVISTLKSSVSEYAGMVLGSGSFAVRARRTKDYPLDSRELERMLGAEIKNRYANPVDLSNPGTTIGVEIHGSRAYIFSKTLKGIGGLPYGTQGFLGAFVEDGRGALAAWMMMRRGCGIHLIGSGEYVQALGRYSNPKPKVCKDAAEALASGALGVVSSQTLSDLDFSLDEMTQMPVYRPLIGLNELRIKELLQSTRLAYIQPE